jgi:class 3 adenylate cyclase/predicted ATPase
MDIVVWLRSLGLERYGAAFRENEIDDKVLPNLTAEDLKDLGVGIVGHRRKILDAIAALRTDTSAKAPSADAASPSSAPTVSPEDRAERRQVTVMFSDLVGSTALSARMDPEDLREVIAAYQNCVGETVLRFGGFVAQFMGDGVLVYFGYPQAHEDDPERAVRAGLELVAAVSSLETQALLQTRVGIATGLVVVGDLIGSGASQQQAIVGETPNLAARLQGIAESNTVVIAESTRKLVGSLFELEDFGAQDLKGIAGPVRAWVALRPSSVESRFEAMHSSGVTELVGREEELELLLRRWSKAKTGEGQVVLLSGEPGIGKSRLTAALMERLAAEPHTRLRYFCSPQHTDSALYPIISQMERAAGFAHDDPTQRKLDKVDALLARTFTPRQDSAVIAEMLSVPNDGRYPALELTAQQRRQMTLEALTAQLEILSRSSSVLMIFEDVHWIDPTSLEVLGRIVDRLKTLGVLLIVTYRPEFEPPWIGRSYVTAVTLNRLGERETAALINRLAGNKALPENIREDIIARTDGIPLFVEEMTRAVLEAADEGGTERAVAAIPLSSVDVPASLHASLMARLDRLGRAKEIAQIGAAIGREFSHSLLAAVVAKPEAELQSALYRLVTTGLLFRQGVPPHAHYLFKHALVQDAAYGTLLRGPRRALHARIAGTLEDQFAEIAENRPELLARHCADAGLIEKAVQLWTKAGHRSLERSTLMEAVAQFTRALELITTLPATPALHNEQIKIQVALITPLVHVKGYASPETRQAAERARLLIEEGEARGEALQDPLLLFSVLYGRWVASAIAFNGPSCRDLATEFLAIAEKQGSAAMLVIAHRIAGQTFAWGGDFVRARTHYDKGLVLYVPNKHRPLATQFGQDAAESLLSGRSWVMWMLGYPDSALADADRALSVANSVNHAATLMHALGHASFPLFQRGNYGKAQEISKKLFNLADHKGSLLWKSFAASNEGCVAALNGQPSRASEKITAAMTDWHSTGATLLIPLWSSHLALAYGQLGEFDNAWRCIGQAMAAIATTQETWCEAEANRIGGEIALMPPEPNVTKAIAYFDRALSVARQQQAKSWELRAAMSLARLWRDQGKVREARELLAPVYGWFTEGFDTLDLKDAKALLGELG